MKCPYCDSDMSYKDEGYWDYPFSTGDEPDYQVYHPKDIYMCSRCNIKKINSEWSIPERYNRPTEKQVRTVLFINNHLGTQYEPLLRVQCWRIINENLQKAIACKHTHDEQVAEWHREEYGEWDYF